MTQDDVTTAKTETKGISPFRLLGWTASGLSILELIDQLNAIHIYGLLKKWTGAYSSFVVHVKNLLFGWIHFGWMNVSKAEAHLLVISGILNAAYFRAEFRRSIREKHEARDSAFVGAAATALLAFSFVLLPAVLLPGGWGFYGATAALAFIAFVYFTPSSGEVNFPSHRAIATETVGSLGVFLILLAANYTIFR